MPDCVNGSQKTEIRSQKLEVSSVLCFLSSVFGASESVWVFCSLGQGGTNFEETLKNVHTKKL
jgi:hypothetical protein